MSSDEISVTRSQGRCIGRFVAMASSCELLLDHTDLVRAARQTEIAAQEAWRIERKFSRYRDDNIVHAIKTQRQLGLRVNELVGTTDDAWQRIRLSLDSAWENLKSGLSAVKSELTPPKKDEGPRSGL